MYDREPLDFSMLSVNATEAALDDVRALLGDGGLGMDADIRQFVVARSGKRMVGCAGIAGNVIKCVAVAVDYRGDNLSARLLAEVEIMAVRQGHSHLFLYTRPANLDVFRRCGFYPLAQWDNVAVLMENTPVGIHLYARSLAQYYHPGKAIGSVVMNANPFTLGHRYLAEQASAASDWLHIFVVGEDVSLFPYAERLEMVKQGVAHLGNVTVHAGSDYLISRATFPGYFLRDAQLISQTFSAIDLLIFRNHIAVPLGITHRFVGTEPFCPMTHQYNQDMYDWLENPARSPKPPVRVVEIERKCQASGRAISASEVRKLLNRGELARIRSIVPASTFAYLKQPTLSEPVGSYVLGI
ncbi:[citrate (pro-3S)-lyase] ligase [Acerihabitans sp. TG2]|uniref:[citrate (pro-3S)-lyase] ligase n=1 Tax=Acerihabitans sp. TG2 TaxID=3096008 RepID=UPI002B23D394|nr:[citrate (pro-3S)-lyase] ligase [Acerihabitans sp. TG2]MEA9391926.1 [citrate (pro-3S)-lyase] ligase [Acerihabitans sp. TG2]